MAQQLQWGILGTGRISYKFAKAIRASASGNLVAVGSRRPNGARQFIERIGDGPRGGDYESVLECPDVQAVYLGLPNHLHAEWCLRSAEVGKHVLCEKPLAMNFDQADYLIEKVRSANVFLMEAFMYRLHPQTMRMVELIRAGAIGQVKHVTAAFAYDAGARPNDIRNENAFGGGSIMDVGCYCLSMARLIAGTATGSAFAEPLSLSGSAVIDAAGVDQWAVATARFPEDITFILACGMQLDLDQTLTIVGTEGKLMVPNPWLPEQGRSQVIVAPLSATKPTVFNCDDPRELYEIEADYVADHIGQRQATFPGMTWDDTLGNMRALDRWRETAGVVFESETLEGLGQRTCLGRPLRCPPTSSMKYARIPGVEKPISRLIVGAMYYVCGSASQMSAVFDHFVENGGNCLDTAYVYKTEDMVGCWLHARNVRDELVLIGKGAHPPNCCPAAVETELQVSLERLKTDRIDLYLLHRDNPDVPVGEFIDALNRQLQAGRVKAIGCSNWSIERIDQANQYAALHGLQGFVASSVNLSLAVWNEPWWEGCVSANDGQSRQWYSANHMALLAWSSQASGFFAGDISPETAQDEFAKDVARVWWNEANVERRRRTQRLAKQKGCLPIQIALSYVLHQPLHVFALIGPRRPRETRESIDAMQVELSPAELAWLDLAEDFGGR